MRALPVATIGRIPIRVHWTFLVALPFFAVAVGLPLTLILFVSVLIHELAHALYARSHGAQVLDIVLLPIGGVSRIADAPREARHEAMMALVGPLASLALAAFCITAGRLTPPEWLQVRDILIGAGEINGVLGLFNLLPAFPMDGGRVMRAALSPRLGADRATRVAALVGKVFAGLFVVFGLLRPDLVLVMIGLFVYIGAEAEAREMHMRTALGGIRVRDLMNRSPVALLAGATVSDAAERMVAEQRVGLPVVEAAGRVVGVVTLHEIQAIPGDKRASVAVERIARRARQVGPEDDAWQALRWMAEGGVPILPVVEAGRLIGAIEQAAILRGAQLRDLVA